MVDIQLPLVSGILRRGNQDITVVFHSISIPQNKIKFFFSSSWSAKNLYMLSLVSFLSTIISPLAPWIYILFDSIIFAQWPNLK